jgi:hypothetical protein
MVTPPVPANRLPANPSSSDHHASHPLSCKRESRHPPYPNLASSARPRHAAAAAAAGEAAPSGGQDKPKRSEEELEDLVEKFMREQAEKESGGEAARLD